MIHHNVQSEGTHQASQRNGEGFLYLYVSIMLAIFGVVFVVDVHSNRAVESAIETQRGSADLSHYRQSTIDAKVLVDRAIHLFLDKQSSFHLGGVDALRFLLRSHDVHARILITGSPNNPELAYARALLLQTELENSSLYHNDVSIELDFSSDNGGQVFVTLYEGVSAEENVS